MVISLNEPLEPMAAVSLEVDGGLVMAEVYACSKEGDSGYTARLSIDQVIPSLSDLARLMDAIMHPSGSRAPRTPQPAPSSQLNR